VKADGWGNPGLKKRERRDTEESLEIANFPQEEQGRGGNNGR